MDPLTLHRLHFAFTITYHYLFPQLTMGLALLIFVLKTLSLRTRDPDYDRAAHFWIKVFGVAFVMGVVTGIPMEFQFGTNWARFSRISGGIIGQTLAMEGVFAFFLESSFLYALLFGKERLGPVGHWVVSLLMWVGTWLSGYFIVATNAFMQHPYGYSLGPDSVMQLESLWALLTNPWLLPQYAHTMIGSLITACFAMSAGGAFYLLRARHVPVAQKFLRVSVSIGLLASVAAALPTGDLHAKMVYAKQPVAFAAMEGHFHTERGAGLTLIGQPDMEKLTLDNPITLPKMLSVLTHQRWDTEIKGLVEFPRDQWPDNIPLLYYSYHVMAGLGTLFIAAKALAALQLWRKRLFEQRALLWLLLVMFPLPFVANTAGWMTSELGRQPWLVYGILRTRDGSSEHVGVGTTLFSLLGFMGLYALLSLLFFFVMTRLIAKGPDPDPGASAASPLEASHA